MHVDPAYRRLPKIPVDDAVFFADRPIRQYVAGVILDVDLPPMTSRFQKAESFLRQSDYAQIFQLVMQNTVCFRCGGTGPLYCRELLSCDEATGEHVLDGFEALCHGCSLVRRYGESWLRGLAKVADAHFRRVNRLSEAEASGYISRAVVTWALRSKRHWKLRLDVLSTYGVNPKTYETLLVSHAPNHR